ncbi:hypothetical protein Ddye_030320 [Dipteronia dyeriana]|uniref:MULE transposase domain-containing protein n=1 Tax=Dipteronia dyeriana TaxID=168575 RepID=A0AAD9TH57_9ROSI|nr:hypothetical protein Ddye_030320 [Dipteronia dyeriana]
MKPRADTRIGCSAHLSKKLDREKNIFFVNRFVDEHNHPLVMQNGLAEQSGIPLKSSYELLGRQVGGRESLGYTKRDQKDYLRSKQQNKLACEDASEEQIINIFWTDARMIMDYGHFGDVVSFDTTYKTNKENRSFGVFVGLNHHRETVAMSEKIPKTILTDQDAAMAKAISHVMPTTYHMLCTWHMMKHALKHVNGVFRGSGGVKSILSKFIDEIEEENLF